MPEMEQTLFKQTMPDTTDPDTLPPSVQALLQRASRSTAPIRLAPNSCSALR